MPTSVLTITASRGEIASVITGTASSPKPKPASTWTNDATNTAERDHDQLGGRHRERPHQGTGDCGAGRGAADARAATYARRPCVEPDPSEMAVVDISAPDAPDAIDRACRAMGFFALGGHGIDGARRERLLAAARELFALDDERSGGWRWRPAAAPGAAGSRSRAS